MLHDRRVHLQGRSHPVEPYLVYRVKNPCRLVYLIDKLFAFRYDYGSSEWCILDLLPISVRLNDTDRILEHDVFVALAYRGMDTLRTPLTSLHHP